MNAWDAVRTKRAVREFANRPIEPERLERIVAQDELLHQERWGG